jgi:ligand-binding SRPBCC domain-containing protein
VIYRRTFSSRLQASPATVWDWITSFDGIAREMAPYLRMSSPMGVTRIDVDQIVPGQRLFRSWIKLFGLIPIDYSDLTLVRVEPGVGFVEESPMGTMHRWRHARRITPEGQGAVLCDELEFEPRMAGWLTVKVIEAFFTHRHRKLRRCLGG